MATEWQDFTVHKIMKGENGRFQPVCEKAANCKGGRK